MGSAGGGIAPDIETALSRSPELAEALGAAGSRIPSIPPKLSGIMDVQDLLQEALMGVTASPDPAQHAQVAQKAMQAYINRMLGSPEMRGTRIGASTPEAIGTIEDPMSKAMMGQSVRRPGVTLPEAEKIKATLKPHEQEAIDRIVAGTAGPQHNKVAGLVRKKIGTSTPSPAKEAAKGRGPTEPTEVPSPVKQISGPDYLASMSPEELDKTLAAYERLFANPEVAAELKNVPPMRPPSKGAPPGRRPGRQRETQQGLFPSGRVPREEPPASMEELMRRRFGPAKDRTED